MTVKTRQWLAGAYPLLLAVSCAVGQSPGEPLVPEDTCIVELQLPPGATATDVSGSRLELLYVKGALRQFRDDRGMYPATSIETLAAELGLKGADSLRLAADQTNSRGRILDGWGQPLVYCRTDDGGFRLYSLGLDGRDDNGAGDDIQLPDK